MNDKIDHVALAVADIPASVRWYTTSFNCEVVFSNETEAIIEFENVKLQLLLPSQMPSHVAFCRSDAKLFGELRDNRDKTRSCYVSDPTGNPVEIVEVKG